MTEDEAFEQAVAVYLREHADDSSGAVRVADRATSIVKLGGAPSVTLRDSNGVPLGTIAWYGAGAAFEPPTRVTVVDHFQSFRAKKPE